MLALSRREGIMELLTQQHSVIVAELSKRYDVTEETIRKDLEKLEREGRLRRIHGGAVKAADPDEGHELPFALRNTLNMPYKRQIAKEAVRLVAEQDLIALDASTTSLQLAHELKSRTGITVVTNSLNIVNVFKDSPGIHLFCTGGSLQPQSLCFVGESAERMMEGYAINKVFLSTRGLTLDKGLLEPNEREARMKKALMRMARQVVVLQDHSKFGQSAFYPIGDWSQVHCMVTDELAPQPYVQQLRALGVEIRIAGKEGA